jgi:hypothetical protein
MFTGKGTPVLMNSKPAFGTLSRKVLALLLFALFLTPSLIQAVHHHDHDGSASHSCHQGGLLSRYDHCAICSFEFVSFLKSEPAFVSKEGFTCQSLPAGLREAPLVPNVLILADRAPPLS